MTGVPPPDWPRGVCTHHPDRSLWTAPPGAARLQAVSLCHSCPIELACREWSLQLPTRDVAVYGGLLPNARRRERSQLMAGSAATAAPR